ncbi:anaerobic ribonucleoside-triphosphate reductase activating protein [Patescibacteria group bacterium]
MLIGGLQKTTLIDFPGRVACTVFTVGCNFRCPFCHNKDLVTLKNFKNNGLKQYMEAYFFRFLEKRKKILDGVCITGGEPTLQKDLANFCEKIKKLGLEVKIDTNGSNPEILKYLVEKKLVDFFAMDIKTTFSDYKKVVGSNFKIENIKKSINIILQSGLEYEFRTTVVPKIHKAKTLVQLARDLINQAKAIKYAKPSKINLVLQNFRPQNCLDKKYLKVKPFSEKEMQNLLKLVKKVLINTKLRGED